MSVQRIYRCRFCRQDLIKDSEPLSGLERPALDFSLLQAEVQTIVHDCASTHVGLCDLVGAVLTEDCAE